MSQTDSEEMEDDILNNIANRLRDSTCAITSAGHLDDLFSESIMNTDFSTSHKVITRDALKQLWEESCSEADNLGVEATKELEKLLILFRQYCNGRKREMIITPSPSVHLRDTYLGLVAFGIVRISTWRQIFMRGWKKNPSSPPGAKSL